MRLLCITSVTSIILPGCQDCIGPNATETWARALCQGRSLFLSSDQLPRLSAYPGADAPAQRTGLPPPCTAILTLWLCGTSLGTRSIFQVARGGEGKGHGVYQLSVSFSKGSKNFLITAFSGITLHFTAPPTTILNFGGSMNLCDTSLPSHKGSSLFASWLSCNHKPTRHSVRMDE